MAAILALMATANASAGQDITSVVAQADQAMGRIVVSGDGYQSSGSGFVFAEDASGRPLFLTNFHVTAEGGEIEVYFLDGSGRIVTFAGNVIASSADMDMAALVLIQDGVDDAFDPRKVPLAVRAIEKGEQIIALGYPGASDQVLGSDLNVALFETTLTQGLVSKVLVAPWPKEEGSATGAPVEMIQHTAAINSGNSGGPLLDDCGQVVGMNTAGYLEDNIFLASSSRSIAKFLDREGIAFVGTTQKCGAVAANDPGDAAPPMDQTPPENRTQGPADGGDLPDWLPILGMLGGVAVLIGIGAVAISKSGQSRPEDPFATPITSAGTILLRAKAKDALLVSKPLPVEALSRGIIIGCSPEADVPLDVPGVSRQHLRLELFGRQLMVTDLGSTNGTKVDGQALKPGQKRQVNSQSRITLAGVADVTLGKG